MTTKQEILTPREAQWLSAVVETFTNKQDKPSDERIRQSVGRKLSIMARKPEGIPYPPGFRTRNRQQNRTGMRRP